MMSALLLVSARHSELWIAFLNDLLDGGLCKIYLTRFYSKIITDVCRMNANLPFSRHAKFPNRRSPHICMQVSMSDLLMYRVVQKRIPSFIFGITSVIQHRFKPFFHCYKTLSYDLCVTITVHDNCLDTSGPCNNQYYLGQHVKMYMIMMTRVHSCELVCLRYELWIRRRIVLSPRLSFRFCLFPIYCPRVLISVRLLSVSVVPSFLSITAQNTVRQSHTADRTVRHQNSTEHCPKCIKWQKKTII